MVSEVGYRVRSLHFPLFVGSVQRKVQRLKAKRVNPRAWLFCYVGKKAEEIWGKIRRINKANLENNRTVLGNIQGKANMLLAASELKQLALFFSTCVRVTGLNVFVISSFNWRRVNALRYLDFHIPYLYVLSKLFSPYSVKCPNDMVNRRKPSRTICNIFRFDSER